MHKFLSNSALPGSKRRQAVTRAPRYPNARKGAREGLGLTVAAHAAAAVLVLAGCSPPIKHPTPKYEDPVEARLQQALAKVGALPVFTRSADHAPPVPGMATPTITASVQGDAALLLRSVAHARGKDLRIHGPRPHLPLVVQIDAVNMPYEDFLRDIGYQFGQRADLVLADGHIEIRYRGQP